jgi:hypothetical protein
MFGTFGIRTPVYHAFVAFNEVAKRPARVACTVADSEGRTAAALAGLAEDGRSAVVIASTFNAAAGPREFRIAGLPWAAEARAEVLLVDGDYALDPVLPRSESVADGVTITVDLPADAVCLVKLVRP